MATNPTTKQPTTLRSVVPLALAVIVGVIVLMVVYDVLFVQKTAINVSHLSAATVVGFITACTAVVVPLFGLLTLVTTKWLDLFGVVQTRQLAVAANAKADATQAAVLDNSSAINDHAARINGMLDKKVADGASAAATAALATFRKTGDSDAAYAAARVAAREATQAVDAARPQPALSVAPTILGTLNTSPSASNNVPYNPTAPQTTQGGTNDGPIAASRG